MTVEKTPLEKAKVLSEIVATWVGLIALLGGGIFSLMQYFEKEDGDRVKSSLEFLDRHNSASVLSARRSLLHSWASREPELNAMLKAPGYSEAAHAEFVANVLRNDATYESVIMLVDFYDALQVCVAHKICDRDVALDLFQQDARTFWYLHRPYFLALRRDRGDPGFASNLEQLAKSPK